jgi:hypothetical protein
MKFALLCFVVLLGGWIAARAVYPASDFVADLNLLPFIVLIVLVTNRASDALWLEEPIKRAAIGAGVLLLTGVAIVTLLAFLPQPGTIMLGDPIDELLLLAVVSVFSGGLILSVRLISSSAHQGFKRWRYYRGNGN